MSADQALAFVRDRGVVLVAARGAVPRMTEAIVGEAIKGSWWAHARSHDIFRVLEQLGESPDILVCRLVDGKVTLVHRRLWPALIRAAPCFPKQNLAKTAQEHTTAGRHVRHDTPFPDWADAESLARADALSDLAALEALGDWTAPLRGAAAGVPIAIR